nr:transposase, MuDR, MULE transposase domain protein [Tanacetum cinerariifolium]
EEFCLVTVLKFGVENWTDYNNEEERIPFRRRVFSSSLDGQPIRGKNVVTLIKSEKFKKLDDNDAVSLCCVGILQLVLLGLEDKRLVPNWILRLANDRKGADVTITGVQQTDNYFFYENVDPDKILIRERAENDNSTQSKSDTIRLHPENNLFMQLTDPHIIETLDGSMRPYPSWKNVNWVYMPINVGGVHWVTEAINLDGSIFYVFNSMESESRMLMLEQQVRDWTPVINRIMQMRGMNRGSILHEDLTYTMIHEMVMKKFNLEANYPLNLSAKLSSIEDNFDTTDDHEVRFFVECACNSKDEVAHLSAPERYALKCFHFNECAWKIRATRWGKTKKFSITFFNDVHTRPKTQTYPNHRNANKKVIAHIFTPKLQDTKRVLKGKDIQQDIMSEYKINLSYQQAWRGKDYCIQQIRGSPYESFEMLPYYCYNLERKNEGTVTRIKIDEKGVFEMSFIALGASIRTFVNYLRPLLIIDATHLKGQYKGTNPIAVGMDGNNQIVPIGFGICKGETGPCWSWWMSVLKEYIGDNLNFLFISDKHAAIALALQIEFPLAYHVVCCHHLKMNLSLKIDKTKTLFWKICKAYTTEEFSSNMSHLQDIQPDAYDKLCQVGPQRWKLPVIKLAKIYRAMVQDWYYKRRRFI